MGLEAGSRDRETGGRVIAALLGAVVWAGLWAIGPGVAAAQSAQDLLLAEFDARALSVEEKRVLQIGLTLEGRYVGLIDGAWGGGSQRAIEAFAAGPLPEEGAVPHVYSFHAAEIGRRAYDFLARTGLSYRGGTPYGHRFLAPPGRFEDASSETFDVLELSSRDVKISVYDFLPFQVQVFHDLLLDDIPGYEEPYVVRRSDRLVTALHRPSAGFYLRSDRVPAGGGVWFTTLVLHREGGDKRVFDTIIGSLDPTGWPEITEVDGLLKRLIRASLEEDQSVGVAAPSPAAPPSGGATGGQVIGTGTAFYVNNTDLVTARHVVDHCATVRHVDGTGIEIVALDGRLDLALLASTHRSRDWIALHDTGDVRLGQPVMALGYPYYGQVNTVLNSTSGNVSALAGLEDDPDTITISAPVQPGNSGGPLLAADGTVIGVVVARLGKDYMIEETGSLPENINYAVTGAALLDFLDANAVSLPRQTGPAQDPGLGIADRIQRAVVPILCAE